MDYLKKSRIEEVLIAILGKGMVTSQLISRIEKILDAIRTDGSYDGPVMSEVEEILVCILNGEPFKKPTHSRIAAMLKVKANGGEYTELRKSRVEELIFEWINAVESATYTGTLPATLRTVEGYLESYKIYGNTAQDGTPTPDSPIIPSGCGEKTENLIRCTNTTSTTGGGAVINQTDGGSEVIVSRTATNTPSSVSIDVLAELSAGTYTLSVDGLIESGRYDNILIRDGNGNIVTSSVQSSKPKQFTISTDTKVVKLTFVFAAASDYSNQVIRVMLNLGSTALPYEPYGCKLPILSNSAATDIYIGDTQLAKDEYVDSTTGKIYRRTKNLSPPEEEWMDEWVWGDGTIHPSTEIKTSPFIDVSTCETCIMEVFSTETEWAAAGYRAMAFYDENKQYLGWIGGGGGQTLTPNSTERWSEFPVGTVYVRISCSHGDQPFYPQLVSGYTPTHQFYPYLVPTDPPAPFPQIPTFAGTTVIDYDGTPKPDKVELTYSKPK